MISKIKSIIKRCRLYKWGIRCYTLVELVLVLTIIVFVASLLAPYFLRAQTRKKVDLVQSELRSIISAVQAYRNDNRGTPASTSIPGSNAFWELALINPILAKQPTFKTFDQYDGHPVSSITTPVAYLSNFLIDPFSPVSGATYSYHEKGFLIDHRYYRCWIIWSAGPDSVYDLRAGNVRHAYNPPERNSNSFLRAHLYDPTNGSISKGDIVESYWFCNGEYVFKQ